MKHTTLPDGWHWGCGEIAGKSQTHWLYTNLRFHYRGQLYTDPNQPWTVAFYEERGLRDDGDVRVADYPCASEQFDTEEEARTWLHETARSLFDY